MSALTYLPRRSPAKIFGTNELNYRVRDGNGWTLIVISTNCGALSALLSDEDYYSTAFIKMQVLFYIFFVFFCRAIWRKPLLQKTLSSIDFMNRFCYDNNVVLHKYF